MKSLFLIGMFIFGLGATNTPNVENMEVYNEDECHEQACEAVENFEEANPGEENPAIIEMAYNIAYGYCMSEE